MNDKLRLNGSCTTQAKCCSIQPTSLSATQLDFKELWTWDLQKNRIHTWMVLILTYLLVNLAYNFFSLHNLHVKCILLQTNKEKMN